MTAAHVPSRTAGFSMIELLVTLVILLFGLLGLVGLQSRAQVAETESYQRVQALVIARDLASRINGNRANAADYITTLASPLGQGSTRDCSGYPPASTSPVPRVGVDRANQDLCDWDRELKGTGEATGGTACVSSGGVVGANCVGAMIGARGCVTSVGTDQYLIQVVWQGMASTAAPPASVACGSGLYGDEMMRRAVTTVVQIGAIN